MSKVPLIAGFTTGVVVFGALTLKDYLQKDNLIPNINKVQSGYIAPKNIKIECKDLDGNGELETLVNINGASYLLLEKNGKPVLSNYQIKLDTIYSK